MSKEDERFALLLDALKSQQVVNKAAAERIDLLEQSVLKLANLVAEFAKAVK